MDWNIQSRAKACQACHKPFADQEPYHTLLSDQRAGFERFDVCEPCWTAQYSEGANDRKGFVSFWQGVYKAPAGPPPDAIQKATAESLLRRLIAQSQPEYAAPCYILAVMLERKRLLKVKAQTTQDGRRIWVYEQPGTGDVFMIPDPQLQLNQLEAVQHQVSHLLVHGIEPAVEAAPVLAATPVRPDLTQPAEPIPTDSPEPVEVMPPSAEPAIPASLEAATNPIEAGASGAQPVSP